MSGAASQHEGELRNLGKTGRHHPLQLPALGGEDESQHEKAHEIFSCKGNMETTWIS